MSSKLLFTKGGIYASGVAVDGIINSGVSDYCEFKSALGLHVLMEQQRQQPKFQEQQRGIGKEGNRSSVGSFLRERRQSKRTSTIITDTPNNTSNSDSSSNKFGKEGKANNKKSLDDDNTTTMTSNNNGEVVSNKDLLAFSRIPCSKGDIFRTKLLSPGEKRKLMKFLQLASDHAFADVVKPTVIINTNNTISNKNNDNNFDENDDNNYGNDNDNDNDNDNGNENVNDNDNSNNNGNDPLTLNERQLQQGRSLYRPQNKKLSTTSMIKLQQSIDDGPKSSFESYLKDEMDLSERLRGIVMHALALGSGDSGGDISRCVDGDDDDRCTITTARGMEDLCKHLRALGRYGSTAVLFPMYGGGEIGQAFCRSAAVRKLLLYIHFFKVL